MPFQRELPFPVLDALPLGAHRIPVLTDEALLERTGVRIAFTGREGGSSIGCYASLNCASHVGDDASSVARNRQAVLDAAGVPGAFLVVPKQVHGTDLAWAECGQSEPVADGVLADRDGIAVLMNFADCLPLVIVSPTGRFAVAHAGWRGALAHIAGKAVRELARRDSAHPRSYNAYIGPHICPECFEVSEELEGRFRSEFGSAPIAAPRHVSLAAAVAADLADGGIEPSRIADAGICTKCNQGEYFSYRAAGGTCGRNAAFAVNVGPLPREMMINAVEARSRVASAPRVKTE